MSQWTHVAGVIRIDGFPFLAGLTPKQEEAQIRKMIGNTCDFEDGDEKWEACTVPCGSEGSIQYGFCHSPQDEVEQVGVVRVQCASIVRSVVAIWGDLRDFSDREKIVEWFKTVLAQFNKDNPENTGSFSIRDALLTIQIEYKGTDTVCIWDGEKVVRRSIARK